MLKTCPAFVYLNLGTFFDLAGSHYERAGVWLMHTLQVTHFKNTSCKSDIAIKWKLQPQIAYLLQQYLIYELTLTLYNR